MCVLSVTVAVSITSCEGHIWGGHAQIHSLFHWRLENRSARHSREKRRLARTYSASCRSVYIAYEVIYSENKDSNNSNNRL